MSIFIWFYTEIEKAKRKLIPAAVNYRVNDCSSANLELIQTVFIKKLQESIFAELCVENDGCSLENVKVSCAQKSEDRRRRALRTGEEDTLFERKYKDGEVMHPYRNKRDSLFPWLEFTVSFEFDVYVLVSNDTTISDEDALAIADDSLITYVDQLHHNIPTTLELPDGAGNITSVPDSFSYGSSEFECEEGFVIDHNASLCNKLSFY